MLSKIEFGKAGDSTTHDGGDTIRRSESCLKQGLDHETASLIERELNRIERQIDEKSGPEEGAKS